MTKKKHLVVLTGAGISAESGFETFRDRGGLWEQFSIEDVCTPEGFERDPDMVNGFYNGLRRQLQAAQPNAGHTTLAQMEQDFNVDILTQNVDNLHERAGSKQVLHLHGELMKVCSSRSKDDARYIRTLSEEHLEVRPRELCGDGSRLRPWIVFFGESVPALDTAIGLAAKADAFAVIGSSLAVYPAASLVHYVPPQAPVFLVDPQEVQFPAVREVHIIRDVASKGVPRLWKALREWAQSVP